MWLQLCCPIHAPLRRCPARLRGPSGDDPLMPEWDVRVCLFSGARAEMEPWHGAAALVYEAHGRAVRLLALRKDHVCQGLSEAARRAPLTTKSQRWRKRLDVCFAVLRHITELGIDGMMAVVDRELLGHSAESATSIGAAGTCGASIGLECIAPLRSVAATTTAGTSSTSTRAALGSDEECVSLGNSDEDVVIGRFLHDLGNSRDG